MEKEKRIIDSITLLTKPEELVQQFGISNDVAEQFIELYNNYIDSQSKYYSVIGKYQNLCAKLIEEEYKL